jgi:hypothetical protein
VRILERRSPERTAAFDLSDVAALVFLLGCLAVIVFVFLGIFLGIETQRKIIFETIGYPSVPRGSFSPVQVVSSDLEQGTFAARKYIVTMRRRSSPTAVDEDDPGLPALGVLYTVECTPQAWNLCAGLVPGRDYYARWTSTEHQRFAIGELQGDGKFIDDKKTRVFEVRGWKKVEE